ncbi:MAG: M50 family metallopeptidase [Bacteroidota bacterium]
MKQLKKLFFFILMAGGGAAIGYLATKSLGITKDPSIPSEWRMGMLALIIPVILIVLAVHEWGHVFAGLRNNFAFRMFVVGPFMWQKEGEKLVFQWNTKLNLFGGLAVCLPRGTENLRKRFMWYAFGGPLASLLLAGFAVLMWSVLKGISFDWIGPYLLKEFFMLTGLMSGLIFLVTILPFHSGGFYSDGARIRLLAQNTPEAEQEIFVLNMIAHSTDGLSPLEYDLSELERLVQLAPQSKRALLFYMYLYSGTMAQGKMEVAGHWLEKSIEQKDSLPGPLQSLLWLNEAEYAIHFHRDADMATASMAKVSRAPMIPEASILKAEAELAELQGDKDLARQKAEEALSRIDTILDAGSARFIKDQLTALLRDLASQ